MTCLFQPTLQTSYRVNEYVANELSIHSHIIFHNHGVQANFPDQIPKRRSRQQHSELFPFMDKAGSTFAARLRHSKIFLVVIPCFHRDAQILRFHAASFTSQRSAIFLLRRCTIAFQCRKISFQLQK